MSFPKNDLRVGYTTRNLSLQANTNHTLRLKGLADVEKVRAIVRRNLEDLGGILPWSAERGFRLFRIGQSFIPFASHPLFPYRWPEEHGEEIQRLGDLARKLGIRLSMHPGQFISPASPEAEVRERSLAELRYSARVLDLLGAPDGVIVLHVGGAYGDREAAIGRLYESLAPEEGVLRYLAFENDERIWSARQTFEAAERLGAPTVLDSFHHALNPDGLSLLEALALALPTWGRRSPTSRPKVHLSSQAPKKRPGAHDARVRPEDAETLLRALSELPEAARTDVMVEAKDSELAALGVLESVRSVGELRRA
ncbi:uvde: UV damage endonuclease UvdE [Rubrobacter radiotolerans]|uniref:UV DNA damage repair endonuclease UvsE n=1 Tax=Rubrobacter radiotolerans TaxID=42256 RepID=A0A023WZR2_RUBRA|nr:UV DNA damage repair endonuclease UvsE [Rubrobacter radiotolerans]AHY45299.1 uvde: UV damage endonuclease UvdE [Rubrobacter radiotolerans]MDX5892711.1 UV DNA damage repair endonuclease UvsE [Rubrobacter radiotolerans]SMC02333.1 UV-damage endonuclease [Rubrobacter radiotolerans DSM 5868]